MEVLLKETIYKVGLVGDVVKVKDGYGRNYLVPQGKAIRVSPEYANEIARQKKILNRRKEEELSVKRTLGEKLKGLAIELKYKISDGHNLYGSVQVTDILTALEEKGVTFEKRTNRMGDPIKKIGEYKIAIHLAPGVESELSLTVLADEQ